MEQTFHTFEDHVLPLLKKHNGKLLYRVRPSPASVIETGIDLPYELHLVSFPTQADFETYRDDEARKKHLSLKDQSVEKIILIAGTAV